MALQINQSFIVFLMKRVNFLIPLYLKILNGFNLSSIGQAIPEDSISHISIDFMARHRHDCISKYRRGTLGRILKISQ